MKKKLLVVTIPLCLLLAGCKKKFYNDPTRSNTPSTTTNPVVTRKITTENKGVKYSITYELYGGVNNPSNPLFFYEGDKITLKPATKLGYEFLGWKISESSNSYIDTIDVDGNWELYADFKEIEYKINYYNVDGINNENPASYTINSNNIYLNDVEKEDNIFLGWYTSPTFDADTKIDIIDVSSLKNIDLYARFIDKSYPTFSVLANNTDYTGNEINLVNASIENGTILYSLDNINYSSALPKATNANTYKVYYKIYGDEGYKSILDPQELEVTINKIDYDMSGVTFINKSIDYTGSEQEITITGTLPTGVSVEYLNNKGTNANTYEATAIFSGDSNHNPISNMTAILTINKIDYDMSGISFINKSIDYTGSEQEITITGTLPTGVSVEYFNNKGTDANTYETTAIFSGDSNHNPISNMTATLTINKATINAIVNGIHINVDGNEYDIVSSKTAEVKGNQAVTWKFSSDNINWYDSIKVSESSQSGTYYYKVSAANHNDAIGEFDVVLTDKIIPTLEITNLSELSRVYDGSSITVNTNTNSEGLVTITYSTDNTTFNSDAPVNAGTYFIKVEVAETDTHAKKTIIETFTISKKELTVSNIEIVNKNYDNSTVATISNCGNLVGIVGLDNVIIDTTNITASFNNQNAGANKDVTLTGYALSGDAKDNYTISSTQNTTGTIYKIDPEYTTPTGLETFEGNTLNSITLPTGFSWNSPTTSVGNKGVHEFIATYTPTDTTNYNIINNVVISVKVNSISKMVINASNGMATYNKETHTPTVSVTLDDELISNSDYTITYSYKLTTASTYTTGLPVNAGTYNIKISCTSSKYNDAEDVIITYTINKAKLTVTSTSINLDYSSQAKTWAQIQSAIQAKISATGLLTGDTTTYTVDGIHNGKYKYGTVSGSYIAPTSDQTFDSSYANVIGSTYLVFISASNANYEFNNYTIVLKYKTAKVGSTYYTIEDAINASGTISLAGDSSADQSYIATAFSSLATSITGYNTTYTLSGRKLIVPYNSSNTEVKTDASTDNRVYSALIIPSTITLNLTSSASIVVAAEISHGQPNTSITSTRGILINNGTINFASGCSLLSYGYTKGSGNINLASGASATDVMHTYDWPGGNTVSSIKDDVLPLNGWSLHNISCKTTINHGAKLNAKFFASTSAGNADTTVIIISGSSSDKALFISSSKYVIKYAQKAAAWADNNANAIALNSITGSNQIAGQKDIIELYGTYTDASLTISASGLSVSTSTSLCCPMGYTDIYLKDGSNLTISKTDFLFLPGSKLVVDSGATLTTNANVDLSFEKYANVKKVYDSYSHSYSFYPICVDTADAKMVLNGNFVCKGNIGGIIETTSTTGSLNLTGATVTSTLKSLTHGVGASSSSSDYCAYQVASLPAQGLIGNTSTYYQFTKSTYTAAQSGSSYYWSGTQGTANPGNGTITQICSVGGSCLAPGTLITMGDGTYKQIEDIVIGDIVTVYDDKTNTFTTSNVTAIWDHGYNTYSTIEATFGSKTLTIVNNHAFYDLTTNSYIEINANNYLDYIGHEFVIYDNGFATNTQLVSATLTVCEIGCYSLMTDKYNNFISNDVVSRTPDPFDNYFEIFEEMFSDTEQLEKDIEEYGLYTYEEWQDYISLELFEAYHAAYFKILVGKGLITVDEIMTLIENYA